jgi:hypothetical protein
MPNYTFLVLSVLLQFAGGVALALDSCDQSCEPGERVVSFTDGNAVHCRCVTEAQMDPTVPNESLGGSGEYEDEGEQ